jgi:hypothetical protein
MWVRGSSACHYRLLTARAMNPPTAIRVAVFAGGLAAYIAFHALRDSLPSGVLKDSLPSMLFLPVAFPLIDCFARDWSLSLRNQIFAICTSVLLFEYVGPLVWPSSVADWTDALFIGIGGILYSQLMFLSKTKPPDNNRRDVPTGNVLKTSGYEPRRGSF